MQNQQLRSMRTVSIAVNATTRVTQWRAIVGNIKTQNYITIAQKQYGISACEHRQIDHPPLIQLLTISDKMRPSQSRLVLIRY
jgi:hypothetical protein